MIDRNMYGSILIKDESQNQLYLHKLRQLGKKYHYDGAIHTSVAQ